MPPWKILCSFDDSASRQAFGSFISFSNFKRSTSSWKRLNILGIAASVWETPMIEPRKTAGMIQKYKAEKAMLWASTLMKTVLLEAFAPAAAAVLKMAIPTVEMKKPRATTMGRDFVDRSAASARPV